MIIFVDMDGVLADFMGRAAKLFGTTVEDMTVPGVYNAVEGLGLSDDDMWKKIETDAPNIYDELEPYPWMDLLMRTLEGLVGQENVGILSSPASESAEQAARCVAGKVRWIWKHLPCYYKRYFLGSAKQMLAKPDVILIDDSDKKINRWVRAGGRGILFPQRWNSLYHKADERFGYVNSRLAVMMAGV